MQDIQIIPAINVETFSELVEKIRRIEREITAAHPEASWVHIDVADGTFTDNALWHDFKDLIKLDTPLNVEMHLMLGSIDGRIRDWLNPIIKRNIFHLEAAKNPKEVIGILHKNGIQAGIAVCPEISWEKLVPHCKTADILQTLAVRPGKAGQEFDKYMLEKLGKLRSACPASVLEIDGGVKVGIARSAAGKGANILVAASAIFNAPDICIAYEALKNDAEAETH